MVVRDWGGLGLGLGPVLGLGLVFGPGSVLGLRLGLGKPASTQFQCRSTMKGLPFGRRDGRRVNFKVKIEVVRAGVS